MNIRKTIISILIIFTIFGFTGSLLLSCNDNDGYGTLVIGSSSSRSADPDFEQYFTKPYEINELLTRELWYKIICDGPGGNEYRFFRIDDPPDPIQLLAGKWNVKIEVWNDDKTVKVSYGEETKEVVIKNGVQTQCPKFNIDIKIIDLLDGENTVTYETDGAGRSRYVGWPNSDWYNAYGLNESRLNTLFRVGDSRFARSFIQDSRYDEEKNDELFLMIVRQNVNASHYAAILNTFKSIENDKDKTTSGATYNHLTNWNNTSVEYAIRNKNINNGLPKVYENEGGNACILVYINHYSKYHLKALYDSDNEELTITFVRIEMRKPPLAW